ncbi:MAG: helix-turn-helix domain-containing protein [Acidimicrobiales bacterium]
MRRGLRLVYSVSEAAELLGIGRSTAYELVARGELPSVAIGRRRVITRPTLTELLGVEPPLPAELDAARIAANVAPQAPRHPTRRSEPAKADQPNLPFTA